MDMEAGVVDYAAHRDKLVVQVWPLALTPAPDYPLGWWERSRPDGARTPEAWRWVRLWHDHGSSQSTRQRQLDPARAEDDRRAKALDEFVARHPILARFCEEYGIAGPVQAAGYGADVPLLCQVQSLAHPYVLAAQPEGAMPAPVEPPFDVLLVPGPDGYRMDIRTRL